MGIASIALPNSDSLMSARTIATRASTSRRSLALSANASRIASITIPPSGYRRRPPPVARRGGSAEQTRGVHGRGRRRRARPSRTATSHESHGPIGHDELWLSTSSHVRLPRRRLGASITDSQLDPSLSSASPVSTTTRGSSEPFARSAWPTPTAIAMPWPSEPVEASIPGTCWRSGCEPNLPSYSRNVSSHSGGKNPFAARIAYSGGRAVSLAQDEAVAVLGVGMGRFDAQDPVVQDPERVERGTGALLVLLIAGGTSHEASDVRQGVGRGIHGSGP